MYPLKFAFGFKARSGKDTAVDYLIKHYGGQRFAFSDPIYEIKHYVQDICGFEKEKDRKFLQLVGSWARDKDPDVWVKIMIKKIENLEGNVYISDLRYPNEMKALQKAGFVCILIERDEEDRVDNSEGIENHHSETSLVDHENEFNYKIKNTGTLKEFYEKIDEIVKKEI